MASSLIRGKHIISPQSAGGVTTIADAAIYQEDGVIVDGRPYQELRQRQ